MRCNVIAQRIALQEYLIEKFEDVSKEIEDWVADEERIKELNRPEVEAMMSVWLVDFNLVQPS